MNLQVGPGFDGNFSGPSPSYWVKKEEMKVQTPSVVGPVVKPVSNVVLPYNVARVETLLDELLTRETGSRREELIQVKEELSEIRQMVDVSSREMNRLMKEQTKMVSELLSQLTLSVNELVGQANENATVIRELKFDSVNSRQAQAEIKSLLIQNMNGRAEEIQQLIDASAELLEGLK